jgi:Phage-related protein
MRDVLFYRTAGGRQPVVEFLDSLDGKQAQKVAWVLELIEDIAMVPKQYLKKLENTKDIWEVRVQSGNNAFRFLGFWDTGKFIILCHAFAKKTQQVPGKEIQLAEDRKNDYFKRKGKQ